MLHAVCKMFLCVCQDFDFWKSDTFENWHFLKQWACIYIYIYAYILLYGYIWLCMAMYGCVDPADHPVVYVLGVGIFIPEQTRPWIVGTRILGFCTCLLSIWGSPGKSFKMFQNYCPCAQMTMPARRAQNDVQKDVLHCSTCLFSAWFLR